MLLKPVPKTNRLEFMKCLRAISCIPTRQLFTKAKKKSRLVLMAEITSLTDAKLSFHPARILTKKLHFHFIFIFTYLCRVIYPVIENKIMLFNMPCQKEKPTLMYVLINSNNINKIQCKM